MRHAIALLVLLSIPGLAAAQATRPAAAPAPFGPLAPLAPPPAALNVPPGPVLTARTVAPRTAAGEAAPNRALARRIAEVKLTGVELDGALNYVRDISGANIHVNWRALEQINVTRATPVSIRLNDVTARRVLRGLLDETGAGELITYYIDDGVIEITTRELADAQLITRVYPVHDLVTSIPNFEGPTFNLQSQGTQTSGGGGGGSGGSGQGLFGGNTPASAADTPQSRGQQGESLVKLITETVRPDVWRDNGGTASIRYFNGHIIVTAPRSVHEKISFPR